MFVSDTSGDSPHKNKPLPPAHPTPCQPETHPSHRCAQCLANRKNPQANPPAGVRNALPTENPQANHPHTGVRNALPTENPQANPSPPVCAMPCQPKTHKQTPPHRCGLATRSRPQMSCGNPFGNTFSTPTVLWKSPRQHLQTQCPMCPRAILLRKSCPMPHSHSPAPVISVTGDSLAHAPPCSRSILLRRSWCDWRLTGLACPIVHCPVQVILVTGDSHDPFTLSCANHLGDWRPTGPCPIVFPFHSPAQVMV